MLTGSQTFDGIWIRSKIADGSLDIGHNSAGMSTGAQTFALSEMDFCNIDATRELKHSNGIRRNERVSSESEHDPCTSCIDSETENPARANRVSGVAIVR